MKIIGEKINGTRKTVAAAIANRDAEFIQNLAKKQVDGGAIGWMSTRARIPIVKWTTCCGSSI